jgi:hypothetical protein
VAASAEEPWLANGNGRLLQRIEEHLRVPERDGQAVAAHGRQRSMPSLIEKAGQRGKSWGELKDRAHMLVTQKP